MLFSAVFIITSAITPAQIYRQARIPVLIPSVLPANGITRIYESVDVVQRGKYRVSFAAVQDCHEATACYVGSVSGGFPPSGVGHATERVRLRDGTIASFAGFHCGASCGSSLLDFRWHNVWYELELHAGSKSDMLRGANSMLPH